MFPFFNIMYPSMVNFDLAQGNVENTAANFLWANQNAMQWMYMTPILYNNIFQYPQIGGKIDLSGTSIFPSPFATPQINTNWPNLFAGKVGGSSKKDDKPETREEKELQSKIDRLTNLLQQIAENKVLGSKGSRKLQERIEEAEELDTRKEQLKELKKIYESIDTEVIENFLVQAMLTDGSDEGEDIKELLQSAGYEDGNDKRTRNKDLKEGVYKINSWIDSMTDANGNATECPIITHLSTDGYRILDLLSEWNNTEENIITVMVKRYEKLPDDRKNQFYDSSIVKLVTALDGEATKVASAKVDGKLVLDKVTIDKITKLNKDVNKLAKEKTSLNLLASKFQQLYGLLRVAETKIAQAKVKDYYDFLDISDDVFMKDTLEDLKKEGIAVNGSDVKLSAKVGGSKEKENKEDGNSAVVTFSNETKTEEQKIDGLVENEVLVTLEDTETEALKAALKEKGVEEIADTIYKKVSPEGKTTNLVIVKDGKLFELPVKFDGEKFEVEQEPNFKELKEIKADDVLKTYNNELTLKTTREESKAALDALCEGSEALLKKVTIDGEDYYEETTATGKFGTDVYKKLFVIDSKDGKIKELNKNLIKDGKVVYYTDYKGDEYTETTAEAIEKAQQDKKNEVAEANREISEDDYNGYHDFGETLANALIGNTWDSDEIKIRNIIHNKMNDNNVFAILRGYRDNHTWGNRFFKQMAKESGSDWGPECDRLAKIVLEHVIKNLDARIAEGGRTDFEMEQMKKDSKRLKEIQANLGSEIIVSVAEELDEITYYYLMNSPRNEI